MNTEEDTSIIVLPTGHKIEFRINQTVYLKTDIEQHERIVIGIMLRPDKCVTYSLACGTSDSWHYAIEIDNDRDIIKATTGMNRE